MGKNKIIKTGVKKGARRFWAVLISFFMVLNTVFVPLDSYASEMNVGLYESSNDNGTPEDEVKIEDAEGDEENEVNQENDINSMSNNGETTGENGGEVAGEAAVEEGGEVTGEITVEEGDEVTGETTGENDVETDGEEEALVNGLYLSYFDEDEIYELLFTSWAFGFSEADAENGFGMSLEEFTAYRKSIKSEKWSEEGYLESLVLSEIIALSSDEDFIEWVSDEQLEEYFNMDRDTFLSLKDADNLADYIPMETTISGFSNTRFYSTNYTSWRSNWSTFFNSYCTNVAAGKDCSGYVSQVLKNNGELSSSMTTAGFAANLSSMGYTAVTGKVDCLVNNQLTDAGRTAIESIQSGDILLWWNTDSTGAVTKHIGIGYVYNGGNGMAQYGAGGGSTINTGEICMIQSSGTPNYTYGINTIAYYLSGGDAVSYGDTLQIWRQQKKSTDGGVSVKKLVNGFSYTANNASAQGVDISDVIFKLYKVDSEIGDMSYSNIKNNWVATFCANSSTSSTGQFVIKETISSLASANPAGKTVLTGLEPGAYVMYEETGANTASLNNGNDFKRLTVESGDSQTVATTFYLKSYTDGVFDAYKYMGYQARSYGTESSNREETANYGGHQQYYITFTIEADKTSVVKDIVTNNLWENHQVQIYKQSDNAAATSSMEGAKYGLYKTSSDAASDTNRTGTFTISGNKNTQTVTDSDGTTSTVSGYYSNILTVTENGTYYVREISAPSNGNYMIDSTTYSVVVNGNRNLTSKGVCVKQLYETPYPWIKVTKSSDVTDYTPSMAGITYGVYKSKDDALARGSNYAAKFTLAADGTSSYTRLPGYGTYYTIELAANDNYMRSDKVYVTTFTADKTREEVSVDTAEMQKEVLVSDTPVNSLTLLKSSANTSLTDDNSAYTLKGAVYAVYDKSASAAAATSDNYTTLSGYVGKLKTDEDGKTNTLTNLEAQKYYVKEVTNPKGYALDSTVYTCNLADASKIKNNTYTLSVKDTPQMNPVSLILTKKNSVTKEAVAGAEFTIKYYKGEYSTDPAAQGKTLVRTWVIKTDADGKAVMDSSHKVSGSSWYTDGNGDISLPLGTVTIQETKAPAHYEINSEVFVRKITGSGTTETVSTYSPFTVSESPESGYLRIIKKDDQTNKNILNTNGKIKFKLWSYSENKYVSATVNGKTVTEFPLGDDGVITTYNPVYYGKYRIEEINNTGTYYLKYTSGSIDITIGEDTKTTTYTDANGNKTDIPLYTYTMDNSPVYGTVTINKVGQYYATENGSVVKKEVNLSGVSFDIIANENIYSKDGQTLLLKKGAVADTITTDKNGKATSGEIPLGTYIIREKATPDGYFTVENDVEFELSESAGVTTTVTGNIQKKTVNVTKKLVNYKDITISTTATDKNTGIRNANAAKDTVIYDDVLCTNLVSGKTYTVKGSLVDKSTGKALTVNGSTVTASKTFKATSGIMTVRMEYSFDASSLAGKQTVVYEELYEGSTLRASHKNLNDENQTIEFVKIETTALGKDTGDHVLLAGESVTVVDTVKYSNLIIGKSYTVSGTLMNKETGEALTVDGKNVTAEKTFTATKKDGSVELNFTFDASALEGKTVVAYETLKYGKITVATHTDLKDEDQTVHYPKLTTSATGKKTADHIVYAEKSVTIVDKVGYTNLIAGKSYTISGTLMDVKTGKAVTAGGKTVTATKIFTPTTSSGSVNVEFTFDASALSGSTTVVYETLLYNGKKVAVHNELSDKNQTVYIPAIETTATDKKTGDHITYAEKNATIVDKVSYTNLYVGRTYKVSGVLMDVSTGKELIVNGKSVTAEKTFTPDKTSGYVELEFTFDASALNNHTLVVYEELYRDKLVVASHKDLTDKNQTIQIPDVKTTALGKDTGDHISLAGESVTVVDTVKYSNLIIGKSYTVSGTLMNKETGEALTVNGKKVTAEKTFTAETKDGSVELNFTFDASALEGKTVVAFETLKYGKITVATHTDLKDEEQTVHYPKITTSATGKKTADHIVYAEKSVTIVDKVSYTNLIAGKSYTISGTLMDVKTGKAVTAGGKNVTATKTFTPTSSSGSVNVEFTFDASALSGSTTVVYETLLYNGKKVAVHNELSDKNQTVYIPAIETTATDKKTGDRITYAEKNATIVDKVSYTNLYVGKTYKVSGVLMDVSTGKELTVNGKRVTAEKTFTPDKTSGYIELEFTFDASALNNHTLVVYEELYRDKLVVASHKDLTDKNQTIQIPDVKTTALGKDTGDHISLARESVTVVDTVKYSNLIIGKSYTVSGTLMNKETGEALTVNGKNVTAEKTFTATKKDGSVELTFTFDASALAGKTVVAFETLKYGKITVATHTDLKDEDQTVHYPKITTSATGKKTADHIVYAEKSVSIVDKVGYTNLIAGKSYTISGTLMDVKTGKAVTAGGKTVTATKTFTPTISSGSVNVEFAFDASALSGSTTVVYETLLYNGKKVAVHNELSDKNQTVYIPAIETTATDKKTGDHITYAEKNATIVDKVSYTNLYVGKEYRVSGVLMDVSTGKELIVNGKSVTAEKTFTPDKTSGYVELEFTFDASALNSHTLVVYEELYRDKLVVASHKDLTDKNQTIQIPDVKTTALGKDTGDHVSLAGESVTVVDTVKYSNLIIGKSYTVSGTLMNKETGEALTVDGKNVTAEKTFTAETKDGSVELNFTFDASALEGKTVVAFETLKYGKITVATHTDLKDEDQTVHYPKITTNATDEKTADHVAYAEESVTIVDTVSYTNLVPGKSYTVSGTLMNKETGEALTVDGKNVTAEKTFTAETSDGSVELTFTFDASALEGKTVVAFETLKYGKITVATHTDLKDEDQTVHYPKITTTATDEKTADHVAYAEESVTIVDTVSYINLVPGKRYTISGTLMDVKTGKAVTAGGKNVTATKTFTPTSSSGSVNVEFTFDASALSGSTTVVYETLLYNGKKIAVHNELSDKNQTVYIPAIETTATDKKTGDHITYAEKNATIVDKVSYTNLYVGKTYKVSGVLVDVSTGKELTVNGKSVTAEKTFTPDKTSGYVELEFTFDASALNNHTLVVYEELYRDKLVVASHKDLTDKNQTIQIPDVKTTALGKDTGDHISLAGESVTVIDTVKYSNLIIGKSYTVSGTLMNKETGEALTVNGKKVTAEKTVTAETKDGSVELNFTFDASVLAGKTVVAFETLKYGKITVATHTDLKDEDQTVHYPKIGTSASGKETSEHFQLADEKTTIVDKVTYTNLLPGKIYTISGKLIDQGTGAPVLVDENEVISTKTFTAEKADGSVDIEFTFDSSALKGTSVVVFESLLYNGVVTAVHNDICDEEQTVGYAKIETVATDSVTGVHIALAADNTTIVDTVTYENLYTDKEYKITGFLMNRNTGKVLISGGKPVMAEKIFTPAERQGSIELEFTFDASELANVTVVVFEDITYAGTSIAIHKDINDDEQAVSFPDVHTTATDSDTKEHVSFAGENTTVVDRVEYENLIVGKEYTVQGMLMNRDTGEELLANGETVTAEKTFVAENSNGTIDLEFTFDASALAGTVTVAFETVTYEDIPVGIHKNLYDEEQTVYIPEIATQAKDSVSGTHQAMAADEYVFTDTVSYEKLLPGREYIIRGVLMDKAAGEALIWNGNEVTSEISFVPEEESGSEDLVYRFGGYDFADVTTVVYEELYIVGENDCGDEQESYIADSRKLVACHKDISDEGQTVYIDYTKVAFAKADSSTGEPVSGAVLSLYDSEDNLIESWTSDENVHIINNLAPGMYTLVEDESPKGYAVAENVCFEVTSEPELKTITMYDDVITGNLHITKVDSVNESRKLAGVKFALFKKSDTFIDTDIDRKMLASYELLSDEEKEVVDGYKANKDDIYAGSYVTDEDGEITVENLSYGSYYLIETETLASYDLLTETVEFDVDENHTNNEIIVENVGREGWIVYGTSSKTTSEETTVVKTGDDMDIVLVLIVMMTALGMVVVLIRRKRRFKELLVISAAMFLLCRCNIFGINGNDITAEAKETETVEMEGTVDTGYCETEPEHEAYIMDTYTDKSTGETYDVRLDFVKSECIESGYTIPTELTGTICDYEAEYFMYKGHRYDNPGDDLTGMEEMIVEFIADSGHPTGSYGSLSYTYTGQAYTDDYGVSYRDFKVNFDAYGNRYRFYYAGSVEIPAKNQAENTATNATDSADKISDTAKNSGTSATVNEAAATNPTATENEAVATNPTVTADESAVVNSTVAADENATVTPDPVQAGNRIDAEAEPAPEDVPDTEAYNQTDDTGSQTSDITDDNTDFRNNPATEVVCAIVLVLMLGFGATYIITRKRRPTAE